MKNAQRISFKLNPVTVALAMAMSTQFTANLAHAGSGWGYGNYVSNPALPVPVQTYYANSPVGSVPALAAAGSTTPGLPTIDPLTKLPVMIDTGNALRKFVDTLPGFGLSNANNLGQYIPIAVAEKNWINPATGVATTDDYYEIAAVEYSEKMHSDLPKATHLRGYVQLMTPGLGAKGVVGKSFTTLDGQVLNVVDNPHHLGPVIQTASGTAVRVKFTNYLPVGGNFFLPVDKSITGAGLGPDGKTYYTENRAEIHLVGGQAPWISAGSPHQWVAPASESAAYAAGLGKGASAQNVPDMADPGAGSSTLYFPNTQSARFMFYQDRTSGLTRLNSYAGLEAGYIVSDDAEKSLIANGVIPGAAATIPLIIEDKTFVPANIAQQDAKWDTAHWGQPGDLWFPHVYETNQDPNSVNGVNPVGRWDYGPWFWPIFPASQPLPKGGFGDASFTPEAYEDTPLINGTAYPTLSVDPKAYRFRILNASNDRYINLGLYKADTTVNAPQLDRNGNPMFDANGKQLYFTNTEVKMVPAVADVTGAPLVPTYPGDPQLLTRGYDCLCQYPALAQLQPAIQFSGPNRAWPVDGRAGGAPDPAAVGPDLIAIGNDGGFLPSPVDIPSQPVTYESNRRSVTVGNIYGYGMLLGPSERSDVIVDFSAYAGQTLILYNDAPAPTPFIDARVDYYTGDPDQTGTGGTYSTRPGYGPNTRTMMQIKVNAAAAGSTPTAYNTGALLTALPAAYKASQPAPIVPESAYNAAFGTNDADNYAHVATGSVAQPNLDFTPSGSNMTVTGLNLISSGGQVIVGTTNIVGNAIPGSGTDYDPANPPTVVFNNGACLPATGTSAAATATVNATSHQVTALTMTNAGAGYVCAPQITFQSTVGLGAQATVQMATSQSILVQTKAEQELFDASGRYNSTGGVELPLTSGTTQTTVPLNYIDAPTEIIGDSEVQIWKLVDNGFWSNSIHFDMVDVQLINRVGWDGTLKAPASNEVGWKDTLRLNPLEDVVVAIRAKHPAVPFGLAASNRLQDPSKPANAAGSGLGFTADPAVTSPAGVALLTTTTNATANYDNEFVWSSAILGHSEDDFMRPVVYHPTVAAPAVPTGLGGSGGVLNWTDATPAGVAATLGNPTNEIGFKVLRAYYNGQGVAGSDVTTTRNGRTTTAFVAGVYTQIATVPANATSYTDATQGAGIDYSYEVQAWNAAGTATSAAYIEITAPAVPTWAAGPVVINNNGSVTLTWNKVAGATGYMLTANGTALPVIAAAGGNGTTQTASVSLPLGSINYTSITVAAQKVKYGTTANSAPSTAVTANLTPTVAPLVSNVVTTGLTLSWNGIAGATGYTLQYSTNAGSTWTNVGTGTTGIRTTPASLSATSTSAAILGLTAGIPYAFQLRANNSTWSAPVNATTLALTPATPVLSVQPGSVTSSGFTLNFAVTGATSYNVTAAGATTNQAASSLAISGTSGTSYGPYSVSACNNNGATCSTASNAVTQITLPAAPVISGVTAVSATGMTVNWGTVTGATGYTLQVSTNGGSTWTNVGTSANGVRTTATSLAAGSTSAAISGLTGNTSYIFQLRASDAAGVGAFSPTSAAQLTPPNTPTGVTAANGAANAPITGGLNWTAPTGGATSYLVSWTGPASGSANTTSGQQLTFTAAGTYLMTVTAINATGNSVPSGPVNVTVR